MTDYELLQQAMRRNPSAKSLGLLAIGAAALAALLTYAPALASLF